MTKLSYDKRDYLNIGEQPLSGTSFVNWMRLLIENRFRVDWRFIPKALYVTVMIIIMMPFRIYEKRKCDKKLKDVKVVSPLFIVGHWRSGTTFLHYLLGQDKNLAYVSTFETMAPGMIIENEKFFKDIVKNHLPDKRPMDDLELNADLPYEEEYAVANLSPYSFYHGWYFPKRMRQYFRQYVLFENLNDGIKDRWMEVYNYFLKKIAYKNKGKRIMLKSLVNTAKIPILLEMYPDAKFIHIYRDPYKVYLSTWKLYKKILPIFSFQHVSSEQLDREILFNYRALFERYLEDRKLIPKGNLIEISYEDFVKNQVKTIEAVYAKLGLEGFEKAKPAFERYVKKHENYTPDNYTIDDRIKKKVYNEWKLTFEEYGYKK
ncbi:MAG: sulfotransferase [Thermoplasmatales archaeon]|nr:sulfotransferase [Thermoplasmatales archaeon]